MSGFLRMPGWAWNGIVEFRVFLGFITLEVLVDAASEPGTCQGKDLATWICRLSWSSGHNPNLAPSCLRNRHIPELNPDFLSDSLKEKTAELLLAARRAGTAPGWGVPVTSRLEQIPPGQGCWSWGCCSHPPQNPWMDTWN